LNPILQISKHLIPIVLLVFFCLISCERVPEPKQFSGNPLYRTTDPSRLYFNNIRSNSYYRQRKTNTKIDIYKYRKLKISRKEPLIQAKIVNNWLQDEAYIFIDKNDYVGGFSDTLTVQWQADSTSGYHYLALANKKNQYDFAQAIYESIEARHSLSVKTLKNGFVPVFDNREERVNFRTTLNDYYKLTERKGF